MPAPSPEPSDAAGESGKIAKASKRCPSCGGRYPSDFKVCPRDATPLEDAAADEDPLIGSALGESYEVVRLIGEGGMGRVYEARHRRLAGKRYAVKILHQELSRQAEVMARFQREAEASSALAHPNVVSVFDIGSTDEGRPYIVCELLEGQELGAYLDRVGKLDPPSAVHVVRQVCDALAAAHAHGIVHRDVKPENVFVTGDPTAPVIKVLDFGISKLAQENQNLTRTGTVMGTPAYMAPEQARGDKVDARADVYAAGAILYRALTGRGPFEGLDPMATLTAVLAEEPPRPRSISAGIPPELELVIQRAMAKEARERYQTMLDFAEALAPFDTGEVQLVGHEAPAQSRAAPTILSRARAQDAVAKTLLAGPPATAAMAANAREAKLARPAIVMLTVSGLGLSLALAVDVVASVIRLVAGRDLTATEAVLTAVAALLVLATPAVLWTRFLARKVWVSTPKAIDLAHRLRRAVLGAAAGYGMAALVVHVVSAVVRRTATAGISPLWHLFMFGSAIALGTALWFSTGLGRARS